MRFYREALVRNPGFADAHNNLGQALELTGDFAAARQQYEAAIIDNPHLGGTWFNLGGVAERLGDKQQALVAYRRAQGLLVALPEYQNYAVRAEQAIQRLE
jgi:Tfp pilus assembly protein PilF